MRSDQQWTKEVEEILRNYTIKLNRVLKHIEALKTDIKTLFIKKRQIENLLLQNALQVRLTQAQTDISMLSQRQANAKANMHLFEVSKAKMDMTVAQIEGTLKQLQQSDTVKSTPAGFDTNPDSVLSTNGATAGTSTSSNTASKKSSFMEMSASVPVSPSSLPSPSSNEKQQPATGNVLSMVDVDETLSASAYQKSLNTLTTHTRDLIESAKKAQAEEKELLLERENMQSSKRHQVPVGAFSLPKLPVSLELPKDMQDNDDDKKHKATMADASVLSFLQVGNTRVRPSGGTLSNENVQQALKEASATIVKLHGLQHALQNELYAVEGREDVESKHGRGMEL